MADKIPATMTIGGSMSAEVRAQLNELIEAAGPDEFSPGNGQEPLRFAVFEQYWGSFEQIEAFCRSRGLSFLRHTDSKYEFDAVNVWWNLQIQEKFGEPLQGYSTQAGQPLISVEKVRDMLENSGRPLHDALVMLEDFTPTEVPPVRDVETDSCSLEQGGNPNGEE